MPWGNLSLLKNSYLQTTIARVLELPLEYIEAASIVLLLYQYIPPSGDGR